MTIRRVEGVNVPYTYPDEITEPAANVRTEASPEKLSENPQKHSQQLAELKLQADSRSAELNTQIPNLKTFKGEMVGLEPTVIDSPREDQDGFFLPEVNDEVL